MTKQRTTKDYIIATRPWSFTASIMPILISWGYLAFIYNNGGAESVNLLNAALCLPLLVLAHAGGNMVSDYFDYTRHVDLKDGPNGVTWIYDGTFQSREILSYGLCLLTLVVPLGLFLLYNSSWEAIWVGVAGMTLALSYPWMKAHVLGDVNILISFALLPAVGTAFVTTGSYHPEMLLFILPLGLLTVAILHSNNTRDIGNDARAGLSTFCAAIGFKASQWVYVVEVFLPYVLTIVYVVFMHQPLTLLIVILTLPLAIRNARIMLQGDESKTFLGIPTLDKNSAQLQMSFGLLYAVGYFLYCLF